MKATSAHAVVVVLLFLAAVSPAVSGDGIQLLASKGPGAGEVTFAWTGGLPLFQVRRSTLPNDVATPAKLWAETNDSSVVDAGPSVGLLVYVVEEYCPGGSCPLAEVPASPPAEPCGSCACSTQEGGPLHSTYLFSGEFYLEVEDLRIRGRGIDFVWARKYRSRGAMATAMGNEWDYSYDLRVEQSGPDIVVHDGNTRSDLYLPRPDGTWSKREIFRVLSQLPDGSFRLTFADSGQWNFRKLDGSPAQGRIATIVDRNGNTLSFAYDGLGRLATITDTLGRLVTVQYDGDGFIESVTDFTGRQVRYAYYQDPDVGGSFGDLKSVASPAVSGTGHNDFPLGKTTVYTYSEGSVDWRLNHNLLTITDPRGQIWLRNTYAVTTNPADPDFDHLTRQSWGDIGDVLDVTYVRPVPDAANAFTRNKAIVNDRVGNVREYFYDSRNRLVIKREFTGRADPDSPTTETVNRPAGKLRPSDPDFFETRWDYNVDSLPTLVRHPNLNTVANTYELALDPAADPRTRGNLRQVVRSPGPLGGNPSTIAESYTYETGLGGCGCGTNFVKTHTDGRVNTTSHTYDARGNRLHTDHPTGGGAEDWTYNVPFGQVTSHTLPANGSGSRRVDTYTYHAAGPQAGYLASETVDSGGFGLTNQYEYNAVGNRTRQVHPSGADTLFTYNQLDQLVRKVSREVTPGSGNRYEQIFWYDANDNAVRVDVQNKDDLGVVQPNTHFTTIHEFDVLNRETRSCRERQGASLSNAVLLCAGFLPGQAVTTEYGYDANGNRALVRTPVAVPPAVQPTNTVTTQHDERDLVFRSIRASTDPAQSTDQTDYDGNRNVRAILRGLEGAGGAHVTQFVHDGYDRRIETTDAMGNVTVKEYDENGNATLERIEGELLDVPGGAGNLRLSEKTWQRDAMNRMIREDVVYVDTEPPQVPIGDGLSTTQWTYADNSQETSRTDPLPGHVTSLLYDTANRLRRVTDARNNQIQYSYDLDSNVTATVETDRSDLGNPSQTFTTTLAYDQLDRLTQRADNAGNTHRHAYDSRDNRVLYTDARNNRTRYEYDGLSRLVTTRLDMNANGVFTDPADIVTTTGYDDNSREASRTDDNGNLTTFQYDALDRRRGIDHPDCTTESTTYDVHDMVVVAIDANGSSVTHSHDALDRPTGKTVVPGSGVSADTTFETRAYDGLGRVVEARDDDTVVSRGSPTTSGYDSLGNVLRERQQIVGVPGGADRTIVAEHDDEGNTTVLRYPGGRVVAYSIDTLDRVLQVNDLPFSLIATYRYIGPSRIERRDYGNGTRSQPGYDLARRVVATAHTVIAGGALVDQRSYVWDTMDNLSFMDRLFPAPPEHREYLYDAANRLVRSSVGAPPTVIDYALDGVGNRLGVTGGACAGPYTMSPACCIPCDAQMSQYTTTPCDSRVNDENGNLTDTFSVPRHYAHDYADRLVHFFDSGTGQTTTYRYDAFGRRVAKNAAGVFARYLYRGETEIAELDSVGTTIATGVPSQRSFDPLDRIQMLRAGQKYYPHEDPQGSTVKVTVALGNLAEGYAYGDYGKPSFTNSIGNPIPQSTIGNARLYHGHFFDGESGFYWTGARNLAPDVGRYVERDTDAIEGAGLPHPYSYLGSNPTSWPATTFDFQGNGIDPGNPPYLTTASWVSPPTMPRQEGKKGCTGECKVTAGPQTRSYSGKCPNKHGRETRRERQRLAEKACEFGILQPLPAELDECKKQTEKCFCTLVKGGPDPAPNAERDCRTAGKKTDYPTCECTCTLKATGICVAKPPGGGPFKWF